MLGQHCLTLLWFLEHLSSAFVCTDANCGRLNSEPNVDGILGLGCSMYDCRCNQASD
jgi:hypothetical protein